VAGYEVWVGFEFLKNIEGLSGGFQSLFQLALLGVEISQVVKYTGLAVAVSQFTLDA